MRDWDLSFKNQLLEVHTYRDFLKLFFYRPLHLTRPRKMSFAEFARKCDFASKSYIHDVIAGRKRLTPNAFEKVIAGLKLTSIWTDYFKCLVGAEESDFHISKKNEIFFLTRQNKLRDQIQRSLSVRTISTADTKAQEVFLTTNFPEIYASLGEVNVGTTMEGIIRRSRLPASSIQKALKDFESIGLIKFDSVNCRYIPLAVGLESYGLKNADIFRHDFFASLEKAKCRFPRQAVSGEALFMTQSMSVASSELSKFRQQLSDLIETFAVQTESSDGDCIAEVCISFTNNL